MTLLEKLEIADAYLSTLNCEHEALSLIQSAITDVKAIRAEAYQQGRDDMKEEAAKLAYDLRFRSCWTAEAIAAAIRGAEMKVSFWRKE